MTRAIQSAPPIPKRFGIEKQAGLLVEIHVLAGVEHVKTADPERHGAAENQHAQIEMAGDGDPRGSGRNPSAKPRKRCDQFVKRL